MSLIRGNALALPLADESVDLIVTSPPYFALRSYTDGGEHYDGQIGSEATPAEFVAALLEVTRECVRVLKPSGSMWVNLGDKYSNRVATRPSSHQDGLQPGQGHEKDWKRDRDLGLARMPSQNIIGSGPIREKSLMGLPWRYALGCIDDLGLILRAEVIWSKPNGLPESVQDRVRRSHEQWFHFTREPRYYSAVDEVREPHVEPQRPGVLTWDERRGREDQAARYSDQNGHGGTAGMAQAALGKLPGSVWTIPTEPLRVPDHLPQHFAAFPSEWPRRIILGWSPSGICVECGDGRRPVVAKGELRPARGKLLGDIDDLDDPKLHGRAGDTHKASENMVRTTEGWSFLTRDSSIVGESCACAESRGTPAAGGSGSVENRPGRPAALPPTRPAVVLDPFCGTGTTPAVANALGRHGIGVDLSADYLRLAAWRCADPGLRAKVLGVDKPAPEVPGQMSLEVA